MKRASYKEAVAWIANNDSDGDGDALEIESVKHLVTVCLVADIFQVETDKVALDVIKVRSRGPS